jgi:hypothetical protein
MYTTPRKNVVNLDSQYNAFSFVEISFNKRKRYAGYLHFTTFSGASVPYS